MNGRLILELLTPESRRSVEDLVAVSAFLTDGSIGILPGHAPLLGEIAPETIRYRGADGREGDVSPGSGILQVEEGRVWVFAVSAGGENGPVPKRLLRNVRMEAGLLGEADEKEG
jgi:F-type H+-transporting ATPase subunit epsilon